MILLLTGVTRVGTSAIGRNLAEDLGFQFFDLDVEIERFYGKSMSDLKADMPTEHSWRMTGALVLKTILEENRSKDTVVSLPPSGLMDAYFRVIKKFGAFVVVLKGTPENILNWITVYDRDSKPMNKELNEREKKYVLSEIRKDITYYKRSYNRAHFQVDIPGLDEGQAASKLREILGFEPPVIKEPGPPQKKQTLSLVSRAISHTNRRGKTYYLHIGKTRKGNPRYYFSMKDAGELGTKIPYGYEIYEDPNAQVFLRKIMPKLIRDEEVVIIDHALKKHAGPSDYKIDVRGEIITIFESNQRSQESRDFAPFFSIAWMQDWNERHATYMRVFRFILVDPEKRLFKAERFCFRGQVDDWMPLIGGGPASLKNLIKKYVKHLGEESFFELI